ncbi:MAG TPA: BMP family ABC transporter substrate-binding protein [Firmicutes bacterium]|jgi:basic membrane protein A and related proteins|nr:BMP family ABC transporter substrate-binding protein [Bacillota bacterium]
MKRKILLVTLMAVLSLSVMSLEENVTAAKKPLKVAVILAGFLGDKSFNDSAFEGVKQAQKEFGIEYKVMESKVPADWESNLVAMAAAKYDLVIAVSTQFQDILKKHASEFPDVKFGLIDAVDKEPNVVSAIFAQNEGSFLAGAAASIFTQKTNIANVNKDKVIGWVGGMDIPVLHDFLVGYIQGAKYIDPETKVLVSFAGTFNDPLKGKELTLAQYSQGADIVMNVASNTGNGILEAANQEKKYAIGVDLNQDDIYPGHILTSMMKRVDRASYLMIKSVVEKKFHGQEILRMNVANGGVALTDMSTMKKALGTKFPQDISDKIKKIEADIKSGKIKVDSYPGFKVD